jgi:hypothetical protein
MDVAHPEAQEYTAEVDDLAVSPVATTAFPTSPVLSQAPQSHKTKSASKSSLVSLSPAILRLSLMLAMWSSLSALPM